MKLQKVLPKFKRLLFQISFLSHLHLRPFQIKKLINHPILFNFLTLQSLCVQIQTCISGGSKVYSLRLIPLVPVHICQYYIIFSQTDFPIKAVKR